MASASLTRRHFLGHALGLSALALPGARFVEALRAASPELRKARKSVIVLWMSGGPPTIDMWDLKPGQSTAGEFKPIKTAASGILICEHLPIVAKQMKNLSLIRSLVTSEGDHLRGRSLMHTARVPSPVVSFPSLGAVAAYNALEVTRTARDLALPAFVSIGAPAEGPGFLGMAYAPFTVQDPSRPPANIRAPDVLGRGSERIERVRRRQRLFYALEDGFRERLLPGMRPQDRDRHADAAKAHEDIYAKAFSLVASPQGKVFDIATERRSLLEEYGNNGFGKGCLLARKLVEAGVTCVEVDMGGWDLHAGAFPALKGRLLPTLDRGFGTLVKDLADRGLWQKTVVVCMGEFGRTPRINQNGGRDHWPRCWSVALGGGAIKGGQAYGSTDSEGTAVKGDAVSVGDLFATLYRALGMDPNMQIRDQLGRPFPIAPEKSTPIKCLV